VIVILDYGLGNLRSVLNACEALGADARVSAEPQAVADARGLILPGVGAFGDGMAGLHARGLAEPICRAAREAGKPLLGICLGMQLLAARGTEHGSHDGLGLIGGSVERLPAAAPDGTRLRLPHVGWNGVRFDRRAGLFAGLGDAADFYFVHGYALRPEDPGIVAGTCDYGAPFAAAVEADNVWAAQFHPEKSQKAGLAVLRNWLTRVAAW